MRAAFYTLGCKVNQYETSVLVRQFAEDGFEIVEHTGKADVYVLNSCTVTANGDRRSRQMLRRFRRQAPDAVVVLCGCFPQAFPDAAGHIAEADIVAGATDRSALLGLVRRRLAGSGRIVSILPHQKGEPFEKMQATSFGSRTRATIKIEDGCERHCTYCIIPTARGPVRSKTLADLADELAALAEGGYREVVLAGINLSSYGLDQGGRLLDAVTLACNTPGILRVRLGSLEPELLTRADIAAMATLPALCPQFHLSLQSGCDSTLRRMGRHYDTAEYRRIVDDLRSCFPSCAITTDMMVGFPGETDGEFRDSLAFAQEIGFARVHVFAYSKREGTPAARLPDQVDEPVKAARSKVLIQAMEECRQRFLERQVGTVTQVLLETQPDHGLWEGYSANYTPVRVASAQNLGGQVLGVSITGVEDGFCTGWAAEQDPFSSAASSYISE